MTKKYVSFPRLPNVSASCKFIMNEHCEGKGGDSEQEKDESQVMPQKLEPCPLSQVYQAKRLQKKVEKKTRAVGKLY